MSAPPPIDDARRKGARRMAEIPPDVKRRLDRGEVETATLVEWLALDSSCLLEHTVERLSLGSLGRALLERARDLHALKITRRTRGIGAAWLETLGSPRDAARAFEALARERSDMARGWAAYWLGADGRIDLDERLRCARRFAADRHMAVRECAWDALRPHLVRDLERALVALQDWVMDQDANVRRCAVEATRPRGVWTAHIDALKREPWRAEALLDPLRADGSDTVRRAVANWLNDASKSQPRWVEELTSRWTRASDSPHTRWITRRALRTLRKLAEARPATGARAR